MKKFSLYNAKDWKAWAFWVVVLAVAVLSMGQEAQAGYNAGNLFTTNGSSNTKNVCTTNNGANTAYCQKLNDSSTAPTGSRSWLGADGVVKGNATMGFNTSVRLGFLNISNPDSNDQFGGSYRTAGFDVYFSNDSTDGQTDGNWTLIFNTANFTVIGTVQNANYTNASNPIGGDTINGGWTKWLRLAATGRATNGAADSVGFSEAEAYTWDGAGGGGVQAPLESQLIVNFTDSYDASAVSNFTVSLANSTQTFSNATTSGIVKFGALANLSNYNITLTSNNSGGYFNVTNQTILISGVTQANLTGYQAVLSLNASEKIVAFTIQNFNVSAGLQFNTSRLNVTTLLLKKGTYTILAAAPGYLNITTTFTVNATNITNASLAFSTTLFNITSQDKNNNVSILNFTLTVRGVNYSWTETVYANTTNGTNTFQIINGTWEIEIAAANYSSKKTNLSVNRTTNSYNYTFFLLSANSLFITFYDEETNKLINESIPVINNSLRLELVSSVFSANYSNVGWNSTIYITSIPGGVEYELRYQDQNKLYTYRRNYYLLVNSSSVSANVYMLNASLATTVTHTIIDQNSNVLEGAIIKARRFFSESNSYETVEMAKTNFLGKAQHNLKKNGPFYDFIIEHMKKTIFSSQGTQIFDPDAKFLYTFKVNTVSGFLDSIIGTGSLGTRLIYDNATGSFRFTYNDVLTTISSATLLVNKITTDGVLEKCNTKSTSSSATIICEVNGTNESGEYVATASVYTVNNATFIIGVLTKRFGSAVGTFGAFGAFAALLVVLTAALVGMAANPTIGIIFMLGALILVVLAGMLSLAYSVVVGLVAFGIIAVLRMKA